MRAGRERSCRPSVSKKSEREAPSGEKTDNTRPKKPKIMLRKLDTFRFSRVNGLMETGWIGKKTRGLFAALGCVCALTPSTSTAAVFSNNAAQFVNFPALPEFGVANGDVLGNSVGDVNITISFSKSSANSFIPEGFPPPAGTPGLNEIEFTLQSPELMKSRTGWGFSRMGLPSLKCGV